MSRRRWRIRRALPAVLLLALGTAPAQALTPAVERSLLADIEEAQRALERETDEIRRQSSSLARQISDRSARLIDLRNQSAVRRRAADEQLLSLAALEERVQQWRNQAGYQQSLLQEFAGRTLARSDDGASVLEQALTDLETALEPAPHDVVAIDATGAVRSVTELRLGPIRWFRDETEGGLLVEEATGTLRIARSFDSDERAAIERVFAGDTGRLTFDPTVDQLIRADVIGETLLGHLAKGGVWVAPILLFASLATLIALAKAIQFLRLPRLAPVPTDPRFLVDLDNDTWERTLAEPQKELLALAQSGSSREQREDLMFTFLNSQRERLERFLGVVAVTATVSPLLGLLGTVSGMITTFSMMTIFGSGDASVVSGGISEALVTTEMGLVVAIPALIIHALLSRRATTYLETLETTAVALSQRLADTAVTRHPAS